MVGQNTPGGLRTLSLSPPIGHDPPAIMETETLAPPRLSTLHAFRAVPRTGVVYVTKEAALHGYRCGHPDWANLGQGQPETGTLPGGGRAALTRAVASLDTVHLGHFLPDYTAYEELLAIFRLVSPIPILLSRDQGYRFTIDELQREVSGRGLSALLLSNPCNPMGKVISGHELSDWVATARSLDCALLIDEFYSHYIWKSPDGEQKSIVSAAEYVEDVERDPIIVFDGLTKNWRYPGMRISWTVGPRRVIEAVTSAGS